MKCVKQIIESIKVPDSYENQIKVSIVDEIIANEPNLRRKIILKGINDGSLKVNDKTCKDTEIYVYPSINVIFIGKKVNFKFFESKTKLDTFIAIVCKEKFNNSLDKLSVNQRNILSAYLIEFFSEIKFQANSTPSSPLFPQVLNILRDFYKNYFSSKDEKKIPEGGELIEKLIFIGEGIYIGFEKLVNSLEQKFYFNNLNKLFKDYRSIVENDEFNLLGIPLTETEIDFVSLLQRINKIYNDIEDETDKTKRIIATLEANKVFSEIENNTLKCSDRISIGIKKIINYFKSACKEISGLHEKGKADLLLVPEVRSYNFNSECLVIYAYLSNRGEGIAKLVYISSLNNQLTIDKGEISEIILPSEKQKVRFVIKLTENQKVNLDHIFFSLKLNWSDESNNQEELTIENFEIRRQNENIPWEEVKRRSPYNLSKIDDLTKLFGRDKLIRNLRDNIELSHKIESFVIHGQKRVGKSSIVKTLESLYIFSENIHFIYTEVTDRKATDPLVTFNQIGQNIVKNLVKDFEKKNPSLKGELSSPSINGSFSPLIDILDEIHSINSESRIILVIDEFDELNEDFFENTEIGNVFASNIGKGLVGKKFVGVILVGSENTENKTKQGMRLNAFKFMRVDSFNRQSEFEEYCQIIKSPTKDCLDFSPEVLDMIYEYSNGNPYYTNLICDKIFNEAYDKRISYIDDEFITPLIHDIVNLLSTKDFEHFWKDKATDDNISNKQTFSRRCRLLIAFAEVKIDNRVTKWTEIKRIIKKPSNFEITDGQFEDTFNEFIYRGIFYRLSDESIAIKPKIFEAWLCKVGLYQIAAQLEDKDGVIDNIREEEKIKLTEEELWGISDILYKQEGKIDIRKLKTFFNQFESIRDRAFIADLVKQTKVITSSEMISHLKNTCKKIWPEILIQSGELNIRKDADVVCIESSFSQNEEYFETILRKVFSLSSLRKLKKKEDLKKLDQEITQIIIYEPLIDCPFFYRNEISKIVKSLNPSLVTKAKIHILCFIISDEAKEEILTLFTNCYNFSVELHHLQLFSRSDIAPYINKLENLNDATIKCLTKIYGKIFESSSLVRIGELNLFQNFPFLGCRKDNFDPLFKSGYSYHDYETRMEMSEQLKSLSIRSESKIIELKATMLNPAINWKKISELTKSLLKNKEREFDEHIIKLKVQIEKMWKLEVTPEEKNIASNLIQFAIAKNMSAFANTNGGEIFIGIEDDFTITGIDLDFPNNESEEEIRLRFTELLKKYISLNFSEFFSIEIIYINKYIRLIKVIIKECKSDVWVMYDENGKKVEQGEQIYIRTEFGTEKLNLTSYKSWRDMRDKSLRKHSLHE